MSLFVIGLIAAALYFIRQYMRGPSFKSGKRLDGKTAVITGGNAGIGYETAKDMYRRGARVLILCRDRNRARKAVSLIQEELRTERHTGTVEYKLLDLASLESVRKCAKEVNDSEGRIDILVLNAGVMVPPSTMRTKEDFELQMGTNHLGHYLLTRMLIPKLRKTAAEAQGARVVVVSSVAHTFSKTPINLDDLTFKKNFKSIHAYAQSKLANILFAKELGKRLFRTGVTTYSLHPGVVRTELSRHGLLADSPRLRLPMTLVYTFLGSLLKDAWFGAQTTLFCALEDSIEKDTARYYSDCKETKPSEFAQSDEDALKLWELSAELTGVGHDIDE